MNTVQIVVKTVITTMNAFIVFEVLKAKDSTDTMKRTITVFTMMNLVGVWI